MRELWRHALLAAILVASPPSFAVQDGGGTALPEHVTITSGWGGLGASSSTRLELSRQDDGYLMDARIEGASRFPGLNLPSGHTASLVPAEKVRRLVDALSAPPLAAIDPAQFGSADAIQNAIDAAWKPQKWSASVEASADAARYREELRTPQGTAALLTLGIRNESHTDDFPSYTVEMKFPGGKTLSANSISLGYHMLPWRVAGGTPSYAQALPDAVAALMPEGATNRERLVAPPDARMPGDLVRSGLAEKRRYLDALTAAPDVVARLRKSFRITRLWLAESRPLGEMPTFPRKPGKPVLRAFLKPIDGPEKMDVAVTLLLSGGTLANPGDIDAVERQLQKVLANASVRDRIADTRFSLDYGDENRHMDLVLKQFAQQMQVGGKTDEFARNPGVLEGAILFYEGYRPIYWLLLRDGRAVRWKEAMAKPASPSEWQCNGVPFMDYLPREGEGMQAACYGEIYSRRGKRVR